jgi:YceI-like domain
MKKSILVLAFFFCLVNVGFSQDVQSCKTVNIQFFASGPLEDIEAKTQNGTSVLTTTKNEFFFMVPIKSFTFKSSLMQEHFNENYMESEKFPDARFQGKINESVDWKKDGNYDVTVSGKLTIHGVERERTIPGKVIIKNGVISINSSFDVSCKEHNIKIPSMMTEKIAEISKVTVAGTYAPYVKK